MEKSVATSDLSSSVANRPVDHQKNAKFQALETPLEHIFIDIQNVMSHKLPNHMQRKVCGFN